MSASGNFGLNANTYSDIGRFTSNVPLKGRDSTMSVPSHNSSISNLSFYSSRSPVKATVDSVDLDKLKSQCFKMNRKGDA